MGWKITKRDKPKENERISWVTDAGEIIDGIYTQGKFFVTDKEGKPTAKTYYPEFWITKSDWKK